MTAEGWATADDTGVRYHPGAVWGLPARGPGSVAGYGVRLAALVVDLWAVGGLAMALQHWLGARGLYLTLMAVDLVVLPYLVGGSAGKLAMGLRIVPVVHGPARPKRLRKKIFGGLPDPGRGLAPWRVLVRGLQYPLMLAGAGFYFFSLLCTDGDRQTPWDLLARTVVIDTRG